MTNALIHTEFCKKPNGKSKILKTLELKQHTHIPMFPRTYYKTK